MAFGRYQNGLDSRSFDRSIVPGVFCKQVDSLTHSPTPVLRIAIKALTDPARTLNGAKKRLGGVLLSDDDLSL